MGLLAFKDWALCHGGPLAKAASLKEDYVHQRRRQLDLRTSPLRRLTPAEQLLAMVRSLSGVHGALVCMAKTLSCGY